MFDPDRNYRAEMAAYLATVIPPTPQRKDWKNIENLHALADLVRSGVRGSMPALMAQLRPILIALAGWYQPEDPRDMITVLYLAVQRGNRTLIEIETAIKNYYWRQKRTAGREARKREALADFLKTQQQPKVLSLPQGSVSILLKHLTPAEQDLWLRKAAGMSFVELGKYLGKTARCAEIRWSRLALKLQRYVLDNPEEDKAALQEIEEAAFEKKKKQRLTERLIKEARKKREARAKAPTKKTPKKKATQPKKDAAMLALVKELTATIEGPLPTTAAELRALLAQRPPVETD